ncbi:MULTISPECIES: sensor histidine kinase [Methylorubrum]|uniref:sensor histidine kinase n=1 Tax=Methylorubrum TaxID=2282523 RepID=UPI00209EDCB3|nr:PAS domain S-box-containing protein [Methylorubrum zatmanii]MCP1554194.1 PAS domain S-box-containing protein [Methylorubrum extorquens]MCP1579495.1 PAS domain S-box-containing protein [Methylorubrum extorquens]
MYDSADKGFPPADLSPALYRAAFDRAPVGLAVFSPDGRTLHTANPCLYRWLGYPSGALDGRPIDEVIGRDAFDGEATGLKAGIRRWLRADGGSLDLRLTLSGADGAETVAVVNLVDADDLVRAEQNRDALTAAGLGEWRWDLVTGQMVFSRRAAQILGYAPGRSVTWEGMRGQVDPEDAERIQVAVAAAIAERRAYAFQTRFRRATDGAEIWIGARGEALLAADGAPIGIVGVVQDVTTRVEAREALAEREERLRVATTVADLGIFEWHVLDDRATWENERMFAIFGRRPDEGSIGKSAFLKEILHPEDRPVFRQAILRALREDTILHATGRIRRHDDGLWRTIDMAGRFERTRPGGLPRRLIGVVADVTDRHLSEERRSLLIRELHHRVKNTLATVQAIVGSTARTATSIDSFHEAFVGRIKSLAHTHSVLTEATWQTASLRDLLASELMPYAESETETSPDLRIVLDGPAVDLPSEIAVPIGMAIHELTTNAAKYGALSTGRGRVAITWRIEAGMLHLDWRESGGPLVAPPTRQGFGSRLLQRVLTAQVQAQITTDYAPEGFHLTLAAPLPARNPALNPLA